MKKRVPRSLLLFLCFSLLFSQLLWTGAAPAQTTGKVQNVILLIPDGMSVDGTTLARWYNGGTPLAMDEMACGLVKTYSSDAAIADSAPAGSAFATGYKSHTGYVATLPEVADMPGLDPIKDEDRNKPVATILEAAKLSGKATGIISTSEIMHATPADFTSHSPSRKNYDDLSEQQVYNGIDVVLGAGWDFLEGTKRDDQTDLISVIKDKGYDYVTTPQELQASMSDKIWGLFAPEALSYDMDRNPAEQPGLAQMTQKAIEVLSRDKDGFFLMVEGSKVDWAAHANDPVGIISDILAFDQAVKVSLDFAKKNQNTVVISVTDHGNGGLTIGDTGTNSTYDKEPLSTFISPLKKATLTGEGLESKLNGDRSNVVEVMSQYYGINDLTADEIQAIKQAEAGSLNYTVGPMISKRAHLGWTTGGHTGEDVVLYEYAPNKVERLTGVIENTDVAKHMEEVMGLNLNNANKKLFVDADAAFEQIGATTELKDTGNNNLVLVVTKGETTLELPVNTNIAKINGETVELEGVIVHSSNRTFVPQAAVNLIQ